MESRIDRIRENLNRSIFLSGFICLMYAGGTAAAPRPSPDNLAPYSVLGEVQDDGGRADSRWGFTDIRSGETVIVAKFGDVDFFYEGLARVRPYDKDEYGYIRPDGKMVIPARFDEASRFREGLASVWKGEECACIDRSGRIVIPFSDRSIVEFSSGVAVCCLPTDLSQVQTLKEAELLSRCGFIDPTGQWVIQPRFLSASHFTEGLARVEVAVDGNKRTGYIDRKGKFIIEPKYEKAGPFQEGLAVAYKNGKAGCIDRTGEWIIPAIYSKSWGFSEGLAAVRVEHETGLRRFTWGAIDTKNRFVVKPIYRQVLSFHNGLAPALKKNNWGAIDRRGEFVVEPKYAYANNGRLSCLLEVASSDIGHLTLPDFVPGAVVNYSGRRVVLDPLFHERTQTFDSDNFHGMTEKEVVQRLGKADSAKITSYARADIGYRGRGFLASELPVPRRKEPILTLYYNDEKKDFYRYVWLIEEPDGKWRVFHDSKIDKDFRF